jgi:hypothetical protein
MQIEQPFSKRNRYRTPKEITLREVAPENLRYFVVQTAKDLGWGPASLRPIVCRALRVSPDPNNWTEYPNVDNEVNSLVSECEWFKVYDIIEALHAAMAKQDAITRKTAPRFAHNASKFA